MSVAPVKRKINSIGVIENGDKEDGESSSEEQNVGTHSSFRQRRLTISADMHSLATEPQQPPEEPRTKKTRTSSVPKLTRILKTKLQSSQQMTLAIQSPYCPVSHKDMNVTPLPNGDAIFMTDLETPDTQHNNNVVVETTNRSNHTFPKHLVSTFSCHGIEPIYNSYDEDDDDDEEEDAVPTTAAKINQDRGGIAFPYGNCPKTALFTVFDGHGEGGELVSEYALTEIQTRLQKHPLFTKDIAEAFRQTFLTVDESLTHQTLIEPMYSGTTACAVLLKNDKLVISNVGDSRAVIGKRQPRGTDATASSYAAHELSVDQNPDSPGEQDRIERCGGYVSPPPEEGLSARVWLDRNCTQIGLAMSRSIGDHSVKPVGVISEPVVTTHTLCPQGTDEFLILASDGVWEFLSSNDAVQIVHKCFEGKNGGGASKGCQALIEAAAAKWHEHEGDYRDDITALVIKFDGLFD